MNDFPVLSTPLEGHEPIQLAMETGDSILASEVLHEDAGDCQPGEETGRLDLERTKVPRPKHVRITAALTFKDHDSVTLLGVVPVKDDGKLGPGRLGMSGGTGKFAGRHDVVILDECNPKRWSIEGSEEA